MKIRYFTQCYIFQKRCLIGLTLAIADVQCYTEKNGEIGGGFGGNSSCSSSKNMSKSYLSLFKNGFRIKSDVFVMFFLISNKIHILSHNRRDIRCDIFHNKKEGELKFISNPLNE